MTRENADAATLDQPLRVDSEIEPISYDYPTVVADLKRRGLP